MTMIAIQFRYLAVVLMLALAATPTNGFYQADIPVAAAPSSTAEVYVEKIRPLLDQHCTQCHGSEEQGGGLKLDSIASMMVGGDSGAAVKPHDASASLLWQRVSSTNPDERMPPEGAALSTSELDLLKSWIQGGASGKDDPAQTHKGWEDRLDHWAWKPIQKHPAPLLPQVAAKVQSPVDSWIAAKLIEHDLTFSPAAEKRIWLRRIYFDLIGLPPSPEDVAAFLADDDPNAKGKVVDRLLANPRYGERWARHWLDVVHYGDTHGYDKDKPRPNAWPYRDYVIRAWNEDRPYTQFIQQQIAGDTLPNDEALGLRTADNIEALGFISAGPWDFIGHGEVPETKTDGKIARHLDRDNMVATAIGTFSSITIQCAQCHNHKFDPFTQTDYYALQAVFAALDRADRTYYADPNVEKKVQEFQQALASVQAEITAHRAEIQKATGEKLEPLEKRISETTAKLREQLPVEYGYHSQIANQAKNLKWVQVDLGVTVPLKSLRLHPCYDDFNSIGAGFGFPLRWKVRGSNDPNFETSISLADYSLEDFANPGWCPVDIDCSQLSLEQKTVRYVRVEAESLVERSKDFIFALAELEVFNTENENVALNKTVTALDSIEAGPRWGTKNLVDGKTPTGPMATDLSKLLHEKLELMAKSIPITLKEHGQALEAREKTLRSQLAELPPPQRVFAGTVHVGSGAFRGTGPDGGKPRPIYLLARGNVTQPGKEVSPNALAGQFGLPDFFKLSEQHSEADRRAALAQWLIHPDHPLTWRSMANRIWQYHFGRGLVDTPNDFGRMGGLPSHPELLDFLALELRDSQSLKKLHRQIVLTTTYEQSSIHHNPAAMAIDAQNVFLWQQSRRKLEAEAVRDAVLATSGTLDLRMGGAGYQDFVVEHPEHSPHYEYDLANPADVTTFRRSVYRFIVRSQLQPFMTLLDCADPSIRVDRRNETVSATQALTMLNNGFMLEQAKRFAARLAYEFPNGDDQAKVERAFELSISRRPNAEEAAAVIEFANKHGWENACRLLLNLNEFSFVD